MKRPYQLKRRAESQDRTRQKIVDATIELHQSKGISGTTVADIAARAKVGKVTVYRHFPDEVALVQACSGQYFERHPFPDVDDWQTIADPRERLLRGLRDAYRFHRETGPMMARVMPEARDLPIMEPYHAYWRHAVEVLVEPWSLLASEKRLLKAGLALALDFDTWLRLTKDEGLTDAQAIKLMMRVVQTC